MLGIVSILFPGKSKWQLFAATLKKKNYVKCFKCRTLEPEILVLVLSEMEMTVGVNWPAGGGRSQPAPVPCGAQRLSLTQLSNWTEGWLLLWQCLGEYGHSGASSEVTRKERGEDDGEGAPTQHLIPSS